MGSGFEQVPPDLRMIVLKPGDVVILECDQEITDVQAEAIKDGLHSYPALAEHDIVILAGLRLHVVRSCDG